MVMVALDSRSNIFDLEARKKKSNDASKDEEAPIDENTQDEWVPVEIPGAALDSFTAWYEGWKQAVDGLHQEQETQENKSDEGGIDEKDSSVVVELITDPALSTGSHG